MDGEDPDLEAFEYDLRWMLWARVLGKTAALVSNLIPNLSDPHSVGLSYQKSVVGQEIGNFWLFLTWYFNPILKLADKTAILIRFGVLAKAI